jgi:hypothetical protein
VAWSRDGPKRDFPNPSRLRIPATLALETLLGPLFICSQKRCSRELGEQSGKEITHLGDAAGLAPELQCLR